MDIQAEGPVSIDAQSLSSYKIFASDLINPGMGVIHCGDPDNGRGVEFEARLGQPATFFMKLLNTQWEILYLQLVVFAVMTQQLKSGHVILNLLIAFVK